MARQGTQPPGLDTSRPESGQGIPKQLQASFRLWLAAVAAGLFETILVVIDATDGSVGSAAQVAAGVALRLLVFTAAVYLATRLRQGKQSARVALAVLLGGIGTLSLVIGPVTWLAEGGSLTDALAAADLGSVLFAASRVVHLGAVIAALILMFHPAANAYIQASQATRRTRHHDADDRGGRAPQAVRQDGRPGRARPGRRARAGPGPARPQRGRQDHLRPHRGNPAPPRRR
jgi:hypothetical protein